MAFETPFAPTKSELDACIQCGLCLPHCPTFRLTGDETASPRGRLTAMSAVDAGVAPIDEVFSEMMTFCLQCRACEAACPSLVPFGRAMEGARAEVAAARPSLRLRLRHRVLGRWLARRGIVRGATLGAAVAQRLRAHRWLPGRLGRGLAGLRRLPFRRSRWEAEFAPIGDEIGTAAVLVGCVMGPWFGGVHDATILVLRHAGYRVVIPQDQTCCGALAAHDGAAEAAQRLGAVNVRAFDGVDVIVADAAGCGAHLKEYDHVVPGGDSVAARTRDVTEVAAAAIESGRLPRFRSSARAAVQDPCHLRHAQRITAEPRTLVSAAGYEVVELDPDGLCCGAAGIYTLLRPEASSELGAMKADLVRGSGVTVVASANPGCEMQLRSHLEAGYRVVHPVELYAEALNH